MNEEKREIIFSPYIYISNGLRRRKGKRKDPIFQGKTEGERGGRDEVGHW